MKAKCAHSIKDGLVEESVGLRVCFGKNEVMSRTVCSATIHLLLFLSEVAVTGRLGPRLAKFKMHVMM